MNHLKEKIFRATLLTTLAVMGFTQLSLANEPFVKEIRIKGNT